MVEIYHSLGRHVTIETILKEGLKSRKILVEEGKVKPTSDLLFPDHMDVIYFRWWDPVFARTLDTSWVSIDVNPQKTKVFNAEFRYDTNRELYFASEMPLSELIEKKEKGEAMKGTVPLKAVVYHPTTAEPTLINFDDSRISDRHWIYSNEVLVSKDVILPQDFKSYHKERI